MLIGSLKDKRDHPHSLTILHQRYSIPTGFSSPLEDIKRNSTSSGVITKHDLIYSPTMEYGEQRVTCCACTKYLTAICKKCTFENLSFYSRKLNLNQKGQAKKASELEIEEMMKERVDLEGKVNTLKCSIISLKKEINRRKDIIKEKKEDLRIISTTRDRSERKTQQLKDTTNRPKKNINKRDNIEFRDERLSLLEECRTKYCRYLFRIYPLKIESIDGDGDEVYYIRQASLSSALLYQISFESLSSSINSQTFSVLLFSSHLVILLSRILDLTLPHQLSLVSISLTNDTIKDFWNKLCICVHFLCHSIGVTVSNDPYNSLISIFERLCQKSPLKLINTVPITTMDMNMYCMQPKSCDEMQSSTEWDTCDDFLPMAHSTYHK